MVRVPGLRRAAGAVQARETDESHRVATPLELFFDLCFVVAVAQAGRELAHAIGQEELAHGLGAYAAVFFAVWWPWMNYSWFATAFDPDDIPFRLATFAQITGSLIIAAGVPRAFEHLDYRTMAVGYVVVRLAFVSQWVRVHRDNPELRPLAWRWGGGVLAVQVLWVLLVFANGPFPFKLGVGILVLVEVVVPYWAGRARLLPFHPHHIAERYGSFTLIVLGETVSAATVAVQEATVAQQDLKELLTLALGGLLIVFSAWWIYFAHGIGDLLARQKTPFLWGYGHYLVFASAASIGAGMEVCAAWSTGIDRIPARLAAAAVTVPTAVFYLMVWVLQTRLFKHGWSQALMPGTTVAVLLCTLAGGYAVLLAGLCCAAALICGVYAARLGSVGSEPSGG